MRLITRGYGEEQLITTRGLVGFYDSVLVSIASPNIRRVTMKENVRSEDALSSFVPDRLRTSLKITTTKYKLFIKEI